MTKRISILGSTGSIGVSTLGVVDQFQNQFDIVYLSTFQNCKLIIDQAKNDSEKMVSELELKFENSAKIKKELSLSKIKQMKDEAVREIKNTSVDVAFSASENLIKNSIEKSKLDNLFQKNLEDAKDALKKAGSN